MLRTRALSLSLFLATLLFASHGLAGTGTWGHRGISRAFVVAGDILYVADGRGVASYDVSGAHRISRIDVEWSEAETFDLALLGASDLVVATSGGVERFRREPDGALTRLGAREETFEVTRIAAGGTFAAAVSGKTVSLLQGTSSGGLSLAQRITFQHAVTSLAFVGEFLYVAVDREPLRVFSPDEWEPVALLPGVDAEGMAVSDGVLWAASTSDGLVAIDVTDPAHPKVAGEAGRGVLRLKGVAASGSRVFAFEAPDRLHVFDGSRPAAPAHVTTLEEWVDVLAASETRLFLSGQIVQQAGLPYEVEMIARSTGKPVRVFDVSSLQTPILLAEVQDLAGPVSGVWTDGSVAYVIDPPFLRVLDVSDTSHPREVWKLSVPDIQDRIRVKNGLAVLYGRSLVNLIDVTVPLRPVYLSTWDPQGFPASTAAILKTRFVEANEHSGFHVVDLSDPKRPVQIGGRIWHYLDVAASDDAVYAVQSGNVLVAEVAGEQTVVDRSHIVIQAAQVDTAPPNAARPDFLVIRSADGLRVYSLEDRFAPSLTGFLPLTGIDLIGTGTTSVWLARNRRLHRTVLTTPLAPEPAAWRVQSPMQLSVAGDKVVVADRYSVRIFGPDTPPPPAPPVRRRAARH